MNKLATLEEPHVFPPRRFLLIVWLFTVVIAVAGVIVTPGFTTKIYLWSVIMLVSVWQLWTLRWVILDATGITVRNVFRQGRALRWEEITSFQEQEFQLHKGTYTVLKLSGDASSGSRPVRIVLTNDQANFPMLRDLVRSTMSQWMKDE